MDVVLATNDKDLFQLVGPCVKVYTTAKADLASPKDAFALLGEEQVTAKWDVPPGLIGDVLALTGDSVDNIPGIGIGRKSAAALISEFGGLESLLNNFDKVKSVRTREKLAGAREQILQNRKMVDLDCQMDLPVPINDLRIEPNHAALIAALEKCEFKSLLQEVRDEAAKVGPASCRKSSVKRRKSPQIIFPGRIESVPQFKALNIEYPSQARIFRKKVRTRAC
jgi:DNA polymerase-1